MKNEHHAHNGNSSGIGLAFFLNVIFTIVEIVGGFWTNSIAIITDALHDLGDSLSLGLAWYLGKLSQKKRTKSFSYGYKRFSLLGALINGIVLTAGSLFIIAEVIPRIIEPEKINAPGMLVLAIIGIVINGIAALRTRRGKNLNAQVVTWHLFEDVLGWAAVLIVSVLIMIGDFYILDPILSLGISAFILWNVFKKIKATVKIFLQGVPGDISISELENKLKSIPCVQTVHDTHAWSLDGEHNILTTHVVIHKECSQPDIFNIKCQAKELVSKNNIQHTTVEIELEGEKCKLNNC